MEKKKGSRRRWPWWTAGALVVAGGVLAILVYRGYFEHKYGFAKESASILQKLTNGDTLAAQTYDESSFSLRETVSVNSFVDRADRMTKTLGRFEMIEEVNEIETIDTIRGKTARIEYLLRFASASTWGEFSYLKNDNGTWELLGFEIEIPLPLARKGEEVDAEYHRIKAPDTVVRLVDKILVKISDGDASEVREQAARPFRESKSEEGFNRLAERINAELGRFQNRVAIHTTGQNQDKTRAHLELILQYEKAKATGIFDFIIVDSEWRLLRFKVVIPEPLLPAR